MKAENLHWCAYGYYEKPRPLDYWYGWVIYKETNGDLGLWTYNSRNRLPKWWRFTGDMGRNTRPT